MKDHVILMECSTVWATPPENMAAAAETTMEAFVQKIPGEGLVSIVLNVTVLRI